MNTPTNLVEFDISHLQRFRKKDLLRQFIPSVDVAPMGAQIILETLEGNVTITASEDTYIMIGPCGDVYPLTRERFCQQYQIVPGSLPVCNPWGVDPQKIRSCKLKVPSYIYAKAVDRDFCVFVREHNAVIHGKKGDFYAVSADLIDHPYIIQAEIMAKSYEPEEPVV